MQIKHVLPVVALSLLIVACEKETGGGLQPAPVGAYTPGILVSNEGPFNNGSGTVSFISSDLATVENTIYKTVNNEDLGNVVQSVGFTDTNAYIVANVSNTITVVDRYSFEKIATISEGLNNPRYVVFANGKGYVTNWGDAGDETDDYVAIINMDNSTVEEKIAVDFGPEEILVRQNTLYVAHQGGFGQNNKLSVIDTEANEVVTVVAVGDVPNSMQLDTQGNLWVLSGGKPSFTQDETGGAIFKINTATNEVESKLDFAATEHPNHLSFDGSTLYYSLAGSVYSLVPSATELSTKTEFEALNIYSMTVSDERLYVTDAKDFASNGSLSIYNLNTKEKIKTLEVGLIPGGVYFN